MELSRQPVFPACVGGLDSRRTPVLRTDVLVIGGGIAGCSAALVAAEAGATVLLVTKTPLQESNTAYAQGGISAVLGPTDSVDLHLADTLRVGVGLADPDVTRRILADGRATIDWLIGLGSRFDAASDGGLALSREGGHSTPRIVHADGDATGRELARALGRAVLEHAGVLVRDDTFVRDLVVHGGRCAGAIVRGGNEDLAVEAGATVLATGGAGQIYRETTNPIGATGDGPALAFRAGVGLADMEFFQFHPTTLYIAGAARWLISEVVRGAGAQLKDRDGVRFMPAVHEMAELAPRDVVSRAILQRMVETGDTHVYLDLSAVDGDPRERFPNIARMCSAFDIDIARDPIPVRPGAHYLLGGARSEPDGHTGLPGLWVAGEAAATGLHGANRLASNSLLEGAVMGRRAGLAAAADGRAVGLPGLPRNVAAPAATSENAPRIHIDDMLYSLKSLMWRQVGLIREAEGLREAIGRLGFWHHYLLRTAPTAVRAHELMNMLTVSALAATSALQREESRGTHFRSDFPERDDDRWCRRILLRRAADGRVAVELGPRQVPSDRPPASGGSERAPTGPAAARQEPST